MKSKQIQLLCILLLLVLAPFYCFHSATADDVYLTKDQALEVVLGTECTVHYEPLTLAEKFIETLSAKNIEPQDGNVAHIFRCEKAGKTTGYAFIDNQVGKHMPITYIVGISPEGKVGRIEIMVYRENHGSQVRDQSFLRQFQDKSISDDLRIGQGIRHVTGATISSKSISVGVRRALEIWSHYLQNPDHA